MSHALQIYILLIFLFSLYSEAAPGRRLVIKQAPDNVTYADKRDLS